MKRLIKYSFRLNKELGDDAFTEIDSSCSDFSAVLNAAVDDARNKMVPSREPAHKASYL